jgi:putative DNA primase/helicase
MLVEQQQQNEERSKTIANNFKDPVMMAMFLVEDNPDLVSCQDNLYRFNGKCYDLLSDKDLDSIFLEFCMRHGVTKAWKNITSIIRALLVYPKITQVDAMNDYDNLICLNNGVLNIHTKEFSPHSPDFYFDSFVNVDYDVNATECPDFIQYLNSTFNDDKETIVNIIRLGGYLIDTSCAAERMFLFDGNGANGKSILINTFKMFFSPDQISPLSLDVMASNSFSKELLIKSRVNFCAEQKKAYLDSEELKKIITGDEIEINRKFKISLSFTPKTKIIVACNGLPKFNDTTHAIYRRMILVKFSNQYLTETEYKNIKNPVRACAFLKDINLMEKIKAEKSAILNLFIGGLIDLRKNNYQFIESKSSLAFMNEFKRDSDTVREFLEENYEVSEDNPTSVRAVYNHYRYWYRNNVQDSNQMKLRINEMGKRICDIFNVKTAGREWIYNGDSQKAERETMYPIKLKEEEQPEEHIVTPEEKKELENELGLKF